MNKMLMLKSALAAYSLGANRNGGAQALAKAGYDYHHAYTDPSTGLKAVVYRNEATDDVIVAFAGTEGAADVAADLNYGWGQFSPVKNELIEGLISLMDDAAADAEIHFTGHSLGGLLAQFAAYEYAAARSSSAQPEEWATFDLFTVNAPGAEARLQQAYDDFRPGLIRPAQTYHLRLKNDVVSQLGEDHLGGPVYTIDSDAMRDLVEAQPFLTLSNPVYLHLKASLEVHSIYTVLEAVEAQGFDAAEPQPNFDYIDVWDWIAAGGEPLGTILNDGGDPRIFQPDGVLVGDWKYDAETDTWNNIGIGPAGRLAPDPELRQRLDARLADKRADFMAEDQDGLTEAEYEVFLVRYKAGQSRPAGAEEASQRGSPASPQPADAPDSDAPETADAATSPQKEPFPSSPAVVSAAADADAAAAHFRLRAGGVPDRALTVQRFRTEAMTLSSDYAVHVDVVTGKMGPRPRTMIDAPAILSMRGAGDYRRMHGIVTHAERTGATADGQTYEITLRSPLHPLSLRRGNRVFLGKSVSQIARQILEAAGFAPGMFRFQVAQEPPAREFVVQYDETDLEFLERQFTFHGLVYAFDQGAEQATLLVTDDAARFADTLGTVELDYEAISGQARPSATIYQWVSRRTRTVSGVRLHDYNPEAPERRLQADAGNAPDEYRYAEHYGERAEGERLARLRYEAHACQAYTVRAKTDSRAVLPGARLAIGRHSAPDAAGEWLIADVEMRGDQASGLAYGSDSDGPTFEATLTLIPADVTYRTQARDSHQRVAGFLTARVEGDGGDYAYLDDTGRYRIRLPFELSETPDAEVSHPVRGMQPYGCASWTAPCPSGAASQATKVRIDPHRRAAA